jgi:hypothetical protein
MITTHGLHLWQSNNLPLLQQNEDAVVAGLINDLHVVKGHVNAQGYVAGQGPWGGRPRQQGNVGIIHQGKANDGGRVVNILVIQTCSDSKTVTQQRYN